MTGLLLYTGKVAVLLAVFCLFYHLLMERETFHRLNRAVLLLSVLAAFVLPLCEITHHRTVLSHEVTVSPPESGGGRGGLRSSLARLLLKGRKNELQSDGSLFRPPLTPPDSGGEIIAAVLLLGIILKLLHTAVSLYRLRRFIAQCEQHPQKDGTVIAVSEHDLAPFSWWNTIVLSRADYETHDPALLAHEQAHIGSYHSVDILLMELVVALQWFNPAAWLMARDLRTVHEYEADEAVLAQGIDTHHYLSLLMERANTSNRYALTNSISQKTLKNRFLMMARHRSKPSRIFRLLYVLPVITLTLALNARTITEVKYLPAPRTLKGFANDQNHNPIAGELVSVKGKDGSTVSDKNGEYYVNAADGDTIVWTYQGDSSSLQLQPDYNYVALHQDLTEEQQRQQQTLRETTASEPQPLSTSEQIPISGLVLDDQGQPIVGAIIKVHDHTLGTVTDFDGCFSLNIPQGSTIDVMYIGTETCSFTNLNEPANFKITLPKDNSDIK